MRGPACFRVTWADEPKNVEFVPEYPCALNSFMLPRQSQYGRWMPTDIAILWFTWKTQVAPLDCEHRQLGTSVKKWMFLVRWGCCCFVQFSFTMMHSDVCMYGRSVPLHATVYKKCCPHLPRLCDLMSGLIGLCLRFVQWAPPHETSFNTNFKSCCFLMFFSCLLMFSLNDSTRFLCLVLGFIGDPAMCSPSWRVRAFTRPHWWRLVQWCRLYEAAHRRNRGL